MTKGQFIAKRNAAAWYLRYTRELTILDEKLRTLSTTIKIAREKEEEDLDQLRARRVNLIAQRDERKLWLDDKIEDFQSAGDKRIIFPVGVPKIDYFTKYLDWANRKLGLDEEDERWTRVMDPSEF